MQTIFLLLAICQTNLVIIHDSSPKSQLLVSEITRDWYNYDGMDKYGDILCNIHYRTNLHIIDRHDYNKLAEYRIPRVLPEYPIYKFGLYTNDYQKFDPRTFGTSTHPLKTVNYIVEEYYFEEEKRRWANKCQRIIIEVENRNWAKILRFADKISFYEEEFSVEQIIAQHGDEEWFPELEKPVFPPEPKLESPWK